MNAEMMRGYWFGWRWGNDPRVVREMVRSHAAMVREQAAILREEASLTRWHAEREREYGQFLRDELRAVARSRATPVSWLVPRRNDAPGERGGVPPAAVPAVEAA